MVKVAESKDLQLIGFQKLILIASFCNQLIFSNCSQFSLNKFLIPPVQSSYLKKNFDTQNNFNVTIRARRAWAFASLKGGVEISLLILSFAKSFILISRISIYLRKLSLLRSDASILSYGSYRHICYPYLTENMTLKILRTYQNKATTKFSLVNKILAPKIRLKVLYTCQQTTENLPWNWDKLTEKKNGFYTSDFSRPSSTNWTRALEKLLRQLRPCYKIVPLENWVLPWSRSYTTITGTTFQQNISFLNFFGTTFQQNISFLKFFFLNNYWCFRQPQYGSCEFLCQVVQI